MIGALARYELLALRRSRAESLPLLCLGFLVLLSFLALAIQNGAANGERSKVAAAERDRWLNQPAQDAHSAAHYSIFAFKLAPALSAIDPGIAPVVGQSVWLEAHHQDDMLYRPQQDASPLQRMGTPSPAGLIVDFAPLLAFSLAFAAIARERERGTLRLALGAANDPRRIVWSKALALWAALAVALLMPLALLAPIAALLSHALTGDVLLRHLLWLTTMAAYLALLVAIGIAVAVRARASRLALALLFGGWLLFVLVLPRAIGVHADAARPLPSTAQVKQALLDKAPAYWTPESSEEHFRTLFARYGVSRKEDMPVDARGAELDLAERRSHKVFDAVIGGLYDKVEAQDSLNAALSVLSPAAAMRVVSPVLAGGDFRQHRDFIDRAEGYRRALVNRMNAAVIGHVHNHGGPRAVDDRRLWEQVPAFAYDPPPLRSSWGGAWPAIAALLLWVGLSAAMMASAARGMRP